MGIQIVHPETLCHSQGLTVILDAHTDLVAEATVSDDFQGFFALVEEGSKYPLVSETG